MLNKYAVENIDLIKATATQVWGSDCNFGDVKVLSSPYPEFECELWLYSQVAILLKYDRSTLSILIPTSNGYVTLSKIATKPIHRGFDSLIPENLLYNFQILDGIVKNLR